MIYVLAFFLPPLALLLNGQIFATIFNAMLFVLFLVLGLLFLSPWLWLIAPLHAIDRDHAAARGPQAPRTGRGDRAARPAGEAGGRNRFRHSGAPVPEWLATRRRTGPCIDDAAGRGPAGKCPRHFTSHQLCPLRRSCGGWQRPTVSPVAPAGIDITSGKLVPGPLRILWMPCETLPSTR